MPHLVVATMAAEWDIANRQISFLNNEAGVYLQHYGDLAAARPFFERALAIEEEKRSADHPTTAQSLNNLGYLLQAMGDLAAARPFWCASPSTKSARP
ncbi:MAG: tetratricopeptide repeat protein [Chloroflexota bacterium]